VMIDILVDIEGGVEVENVHVINLTIYQCV